MEQERKVILSWIILIFSSPTTGLQIQSTASTPGPTTISPTTGPQRPSGPPANVSGHNTSSTSIFVQWDQVPAAHQNGAILYYTVIYRALPSGSVQTRSVSAPANQTTLSGLKKYTNYSITVLASTIKGAGNVSAPIFIVTDEDRPSAPPANVNGHNTSSTSIFVHWDQVPAAHQNGAILYYTVTYRALPSGSVQTNNVTAPAIQMTLTGLNKYTNYSITVFASTSRGAGNVTAPIFIVTDEDRPSAPPANVSGYNTNSTSIFVQWDQVPAADQNGVILYYTITHSSYCSGDFSTVIVAAPTTQTTLTGLNQGTLYRISVSASTIKGAGSSFYIGIETGCARDHLILNGTNGEIFFCMNDFHDYYNYRSIMHLESYYSQTCSWKTMADKGEQVKLVLKRVKITLCGSSCSCGHLEIENGTYADGSTTTRMCSNLLGNVTIYSHVGHGLGIQSVTHASGSIYFWASYTVISHKDTVSDECSNHTILNESNRAVTHTGRSLGNLSDSHLSGWYRFSGEAGTQMAEVCPKMYSCSTNSSGWLNGTHPTVAEGTVKRKVCFSQRVSQFLKDCCNHSKNISVRNCGAFYVYRLDPSDYYSRYCGNGLPQAPECLNYQFLNDCSRAVTYQRVFSYCNDTTKSKLLGWYRFGGVGGTQMANTCVRQRHCGASYPGWLSGGHPSVSDGAVLRKVCFTGYRGCCQYSTFISVRNCSGFYVYKLSPVYPHYSCNFRYCSSYGFELPTTSTSGVFIPLAMTTVSPYTESLRSSAPPANVSGYNISSTTIFVQWDQVPTAHHNDALLYYTVTYRALPSGLQQTEIVAAPAHQTTLTGLNKYTNYNITVFASTCKAGNVSAPIFIVTDEDTPSAPPANVTGNSTSSTSIFVQWDQVPPSYQNGVILYYTVTYRLYNRYRRFLHRVIVAVPTTQTTLTGLNQGTLYTISVSASTSKGRGPSTYIHIPTRCSGEQEFLNRTNGEIIFHSNYPYHYYYYQRNQLCSWNIMAHKGEQVKLVLKHVDLHWCGWSCSCGHLEIENGTYEDGSTTTRMCNNLLGNVTIYSHVGYGLTLNALYFTFRSLFFRASYTVISHNDTESDECSNYTFLNDLSRAIMYADRSLGNLSDSNLSGWYRFSGEAGTQMAEACPKMYSCSTNSSGWLNGAHPTVAEGIVQRQVCFSQRVSQFLKDCCNHSKNISVRNCGAFYVYRLDPPDYYSRYCGNGLPQAPECSNYKFLNDSNRAVTYNQSVLVNCNDTTKLLGWYRFGGEAGTQMADTCVNQRHCGASSPGWLRGGHPSVSDGAVLRKVCFTGYRGCCHYSTFISVRNCSAFYVYKLSPVVPYSPPQCNYCSSQGFGLPTTSTTECSKYTFLNESNRAMTYTDRSLGNLSDSNLSGWYRFSGGAGTQMAEACPKMYSCSTNSSGWLSGTHPTVAEGIVQRKVCFSQRASQFFNDCCYHSKNISVRNCGTFYVYRLDPPGYYSRFCGNAFLQAPECSNYQFLNDCSRAVTNNRSILVNCYDTSKLLGWYRSGVEAGTQMADTCVKQRQCGASYPGWLSGGHPSVSDGAVLRKVCFTGYWGCCHYSTFISVRNCGGFFVYKLSPVHPYYYCHFRYCLSNGFELPTTSTAVPSAPPMNVSGCNTSSTSIFVHWDQVPDAYQNGALLYYTVTYRALPSGFRQTVVVAAPAHQTTLTGLKIYTNYSITVFASTCKGAGNVSAPFFIVTDEDRPSGYPVNVRGNTISSTSIFVQWDEVPTARQNGVILYYTITYRPYSVFCLVNVFAPKTQITLTGLNESTIYWISVSASTIKGHGPARHISIATACARQQKILNARNGKIIFSSYYYRYNQTCSWKIVANKREQVKLVLESVHFRWCGLSCSCGHLEIQDGTYADGFTTTRICSHLLGNAIIYSHVGHGLRIQAVAHASWWNSFRASYTVISHKDNVSDECSNYKFLNDSNRAVKYVNKNLDNLSDIKLSGWYRFSGGAGVQMADTCPRMYSCSTNSSGWLGGTHPTVAEGIVKRKVCFSQRASQFFNDCCYHSKNISVRNCGAFYVYRLDPPDYYSRYCGNGLPQAPECSNYKFLNDSSRTVTFNHTVLMNCNDTTKLHGWYRFGGEAGTRMADTCVKWRHCGALYSGWLSGGHPSVSDGAVLRKVCFTEYRGSCCYSSTFISVRNCNEFYVYKLSPFYRPHSYNCPFRYCSNSGFKLPTTSTAAKILTTATMEKTTELTTCGKVILSGTVMESGITHTKKDSYLQYQNANVRIAEGRPGKKSLT
ncbi:uncharacterized protein [Acropora muricata]